MRLFRRLLTPPTAVASLRPGRRARVRGRVVPRDQLCSPVSGRVCVWFRFFLEDWRSPGYWAAAGFDEEIAEFYLEDETGRVVVVPLEARVELGPGLVPASCDTGTTSRRAHESRICAGDLIEVSGVAEPVEDQLDEARAYREPAPRLMLRAPRGRRVVITLLRGS